MRVKPPKRRLRPPPICRKCRFHDPSNEVCSLDGAPDTYIQECDSFDSGHGETYQGKEPQE